MVDPLRPSPVKISERIAPVASVAASPAAAPVTPREQDTVSQSTLAGTAKEAAARPPIDQERVARIRKAIADGAFPIYPAQIADRLIAAKLDWPRHDSE